MLHYSVFVNIVPWGLPSRCRYGPKAQVINLDQISEKTVWKLCGCRIAETQTGEATFQHFYLSGLLSTSACIILQCQTTACLYKSIHFAFLCREIW